MQFVSNLFDSQLQHCFQCTNTAFFFSHFCPYASLCSSLSLFYPLPPPTHPSNDSTCMSFPTFPLPSHQTFIQSPRHHLPVVPEPAESHPLPGVQPLQVADHQDRAGPAATHHDRPLPLQHARLPCQEAAGSLGQCWEKGEDNGEGRATRGSTTGREKDSSHQIHSSFCNTTYCFRISIWTSSLNCTAI